MVSGDEVSVTIAGIGTLTNPVVAADAGTDGTADTGDADTGDAGE
jgi:hypothetical protein